MGIPGHPPICMEHCYSLLALQTLMLHFPSNLYMACPVSIVFDAGPPCDCTYIYSTSSSAQRMDTLKLDLPYSICWSTNPCERGSCFLNKLDQKCEPLDSWLIPYRDLSSETIVSSSLLSSEDTQRKNSHP